MPQYHYHLYCKWLLVSDRSLPPRTRGDVAQEVRAVVWQSEGCRFDPTLGVSVSLSKTHNPTSIAPDEQVGTLHGSQLLLVGELVNWVNERHKLYSALDKGAI